MSTSRTAVFLSIDREVSVLMPHSASTPRPPRRTAWPSRRERGANEHRNVGIVVAHFNTPRLIAQLVFSLYRLLGPREFAQIVVVDNGSNEASPELLGALHRAGLIHLIRSRHQRYHGPALTQGVSWLAKRQLGFPFVEQGYLLHLGRGTLQEIAAANDTENRYYDWAVNHREHHFAGAADGPRLYQAFRDLFTDQVGSLEPNSLVRVCSERSFLSVA